MLIIFPESLFTVAHKDVMDRNTNSVMEGVSDKIYYPTGMIKSDNEHGNYLFVSVREFDKDGNLGLTVTADPKGRNSIRMTLSNRMKFDAPVFIIAMPYHGTIAEVTTSENVNLLKAKSVRSTEYSIEYEGQKYNKVLYLAVSLNTRFNKDNDHEDRKPSYNRNKKFDNAPKKNDYGIDMFESNKPSRNNRRNNGRRNG